MTDEYINDPNRCGLCGERGQMLLQMKEQRKEDREVMCGKIDKLQKALDKDKEHTDTVFDSLFSQQRKLVPRWAFVLALTMGAGVFGGFLTLQTKFLMSMDRNIAVMAQRLSGQEDKLQDHINRYQNNERERYNFERGKGP